MQRLEVSGAVRPLYGSLGVKGLKKRKCAETHPVRGSFRFKPLDVSQPDLPMNAPIPQQPLRTGVLFIVSLSKADDVFVAEDDKRYIL